MKFFKSFAKAWKKFQALFERFAPLFHILLAMIVVFIIEWMARHSFTATWDFVIDHTKAYLYNCFIVYVIYSITFLFSRRKFVRSLITILLLLLGAINGILLLSRVSPFGYTDMAMVGDLLTMQNSKYMTKGEVVLAIIALAALVFYLIVLFIKGKKQPWKWFFPIRLVITAALFVSIPFVTRFCQYSGVLNAYFGNLAQGYSDYGFLYGFGSSVFGIGMKKPIGYSKASVKQALDSENNVGKSEPLTVNGQKVNVVVVLLESFLDPTEVNYLQMSEDPIPYFHELESKYSTGHLTVPVVGAGTCDTEFEMLTGMSMQFFGPGEYPQKTILKKVSSCESFASDLSKLGYSSHVVHDNGANFYSRKNAFSKMGFNTFTSKEMLDITDYNPIKTWPLDDILIDSTKEAMDSTAGPDFTYTITVATHGNYPDYKVFDDPAVKVTAKGKDQALNYKWEYYVNMLHTEDTWIRNYCNMLNQRKEPTLVLMFGDHIPTMGLENKDMKTNDIFKTKYITWNNFGMKKQDMDLTSYNLVSDYLDRLNIHDGTIMKYHQSRLKMGMQGGTYSYMRGLRTLQYDLLYGKRYAYDGKNPYPATGIQMGINDVKIDRVYAYGGKIHLYGQNFTNWSTVYVDGKAVDTTYYSGQHLAIDADDVSKKSTLVVNQMGSNDTILRSSNQYAYDASSSEEESK